MVLHWHWCRCWAGVWSLLGTPGSERWQREQRKETALSAQWRPRQHREHLIKISLGRTSMTTTSRALQYTCLHGVYRIRLWPWVSCVRWLVNGGRWRIGIRRVGENGNLKHFRHMITDLLPVTFTFSQHIFMNSWWRKLYCLYCREAQS